MDDLYSSIAVTDAGRINLRESRTNVTVWCWNDAVKPQQSACGAGRTCLEHRARTRLQKRPASICSFHEARAAICGWWQRGWYNRIPRALIPVSEAGACAPSQPRILTYTRFGPRPAHCAAGLREKKKKKKTNGALTCRGALPVLLHPSDGFVLVELPLELVLLQG